VLCQNLYVASIIGVAISRLPQADREIGFPMLDITLDYPKCFFHYLALQTASLLVPGVPGGYFPKASQTAFGWDTGGIRVAFGGRAGKNIVLDYYTEN